MIFYLAKFFSHKLKAYTIQYGCISFIHLQYSRWIKQLVYVKTIVCLILLILFLLQGISFVKPHPRQRKRQPVTNPTLFGGFQDQQKSSLKSPGRPTRPIKPEPHYKKPTKPTFKPSTVTPVSQSTSYDPFSFQVQPSTTPQVFL